MRPPRATNRSALGILQADRVGMGLLAPAATVALSVNPAYLKAAIFAPGRRHLKRRQGPPSARSHIDEMVVNIRGKRMYLWCGVDDEGEVLDMIVQRGRDTAAALKLL